MEMSEMSKGTGTYVLSGCMRCELHDHVDTMATVDFLNNI